MRSAILLKASDTGARALCRDSLARILKSPRPKAWAALRILNNFRQKGMDHSSVITLRTTMVDISAMVDILLSSWDSPMISSVEPSLRAKPLEPMRLKK